MTVALQSTPEEQRWYPSDTQSTDTETPDYESDGDYSTNLTPDLRRYHDQHTKWFADAVRQDRTRNAFLVWSQVGRKMRHTSTTDIMTTFLRDWTVSSRHLLFFEVLRGFKHLIPDTRQHESDDFILNFLEKSPIGESLPLGQVVQLMDFISSLTELVESKELYATEDGGIAIDLLTKEGRIITIIRSNYAHVMSDLNGNISTKAFKGDDFKFMDILQYIRELLT